MPEKSQIDKFKAKAKELECDERVKPFNKKLSALATKKPADKDNDKSSETSF